MLTAKPAVPGSKFDAVKEVPFTAGDPPDTVAVAVPLAQLEVKVDVTSGRYCTAIGLPMSKHCKFG